MSPSYVPDTHVLYWYFLDQREKLSARAAEIMDGLKSREYHFFIPLIILMELLALSEKLRNVQLFRDALDTLNEHENVSFISLDTSLIEEIMDTPVEIGLHDRIIVASARARGAALITKDIALHKVKKLATVW